MEDDYKVYTEKSLKKLDRYGINYVWRDSCVEILLEVRKCMNVDYMSFLPILDNFSDCKGIQSLWKKCQYERESELLDKYFTFFEKRTKEIVEKKNN